MCKNRSGTPGISFHRLPLNKPQLLKEWIRKIRRENILLNKYSRVCSAHFAGGKKSSVNDIPTIFAWTPPTRPSPKPRRCADGLTGSHKELEQSDSCSTITTTHVDNPCQDGEVITTDTIEDTAIADHTSDEATATEPFYTETVSTNTDLLGEDVGTQTTRTVADDVQTQTVRQMCHVGTQQSLHSDHKDTQTECYVQHCGTITEICETEVTPFRLEQIKDDDQAIKFFTGFPTFLHLMTCFNFLGPAAFNLCYGAMKNDMPSAGGRNHCLSPLNEFF